MSAKVSLYVRPTMPDGSRPYLRPALMRNGLIRSGYALVDGKPNPISDHVYYVRYVKNGTRAWEVVGKDPGQALAKKGPE